MDLQYGGGKCSGEYYTEDIVLGSQTIKKQQFGVATNSSHFPAGLMGVGFGFGLVTDYYNIIDQLFLQGFTASRAFGLDLGSVDEAQGSIIFGGIDTMKYTSALSKNPIIPCDLAPYSSAGYWINLDSVGITLPGLPSYNTSLTKIPVLLDSGTTVSYLPAAVVTELLASLTNVTDLGDGTHLVPCSYRNSVVGSVDFTFGKQTIKVPFSQFMYFENEQCYFGASAYPVGIYLLGDTFLRSTYVVYDQDNFNILMAPAANCGTNIVAIGTGVDAVPSITGACSVSTPILTSIPSSTPTTLTSSSKLTSLESFEKTSLSATSKITPFSASSTEILSFSSSVKTSTSHSLRETRTVSTRSRRPLKSASPYPQ